MNSNNIKTEAFRLTGLRYGGQNAANELLDFHFRNPGLSRFEKISFLTSGPQDVKEHSDRQLLADFRELVLQGLKSCERSQRVSMLADAKHITPYIVSAAPQEELEELIQIFSWGGIFEGRVFGSPASKHEILQKIATPGASRNVFAGDSPSDWEVAREFALDFIFISSWSDWHPDDFQRSQFSGIHSTLDSYILALIEEF